jgi:hypothetical protein
MSEDTHVVRKWRELFQGALVTIEKLTTAEALIEELPPESPLRLRFATEIKDLRKIHLKA